MESSRLHRSEDRKVAGVCSAFADHWRIDPLLVRLAAVLLALSGGVGLVLYGAAWLALPRPGADQTALEAALPGVRRLPRTVWVAALFLAVVLVTSLLGPLAPFGLFPAVVVALVCGIGLHRTGRLEGTPQRPGVEPGHDAPAVDAAEQRPAQPALLSREEFLAHPDPVGLYDRPLPEQHPATDQTPDAEGPATGGPTDARPAEGGSRPDAQGAAQPLSPKARRALRRARRARQRPGRLVTWWLCVGLVLVAITGLGVVDAYRDVPATAYPAAVLLGVGLTLVLRAFQPRPRGLTAVAVVMLLVTLATGAISGVRPALEAAVSPSTITITDPAQLSAPGTRYDAGDVTMDLSRLPLDSPVDHEIHLEVGKLRVLVPTDTNVRIIWSLDAGQIHVFDHDDIGVDLDGERTSAVHPGDPQLTLHLRVDAGALEVVRR